MRARLSNHDEVAHVWAQQSQHEGKAGNIFFRDKTLYSYGEHFWLGHFVTPEIVFLNSDSYSVSTSKHQSITCRAVSHKDTFTVPSQNDHNANLRYLMGKYRDTISQWSRAKKYKEIHGERIASQCETLRQYRLTFKCELSNEVIVELDALLRESREALVAQESDKQKVYRAAERKRRQEEEAQLQQDLKAWKAGEKRSYSGTTLALRVNHESREVETTKHATVPAYQAHLLLLAIRAGLNVEGRKIGYFQINKLTDKALIVGCHTIPLSEINRIAPEVAMIAHKEEMTA